MSQLSTAQARMLELVAGASSRNAPFIPPNGPSGRPAKFLKRAELVVERTPGALWITDAGKRALDRVKGTAA